MHSQQIDLIWAVFEGGERFLIILSQSYNQVEMMSVNPVKEKALSKGEDELLVILTNGFEAVLIFDGSLSPSFDIHFMKVAAAA